MVDEFVLGKGMYTWIIERCGEPSGLVNQAKTGGCTHLLVKLADGVYPYYGRNYGSSSSRDFTMELVEACKQAGIEPVAWQYVYGTSPITEANVILQRMNNAGLKKLIVNAEVEYKAPGMGSKAIQYCQRLKSEMGDIQLGLSSYRFPNYHQEFPWGEFGQFMDCYLPQVYWQGAHNPVEQLGRCLREYANLPYPNKPIYPTGAAYKYGGWQPEPGEITAFMSAAKNVYGLKAVDFWEWYNATIYIPYCWSEIAAFDYGNPVPPPPPPPPSCKTQMEVLVQGMHIRSAPNADATELGHLNAGEILDVLDVGGSESWIKHERGWSAVYHAGKHYMKPK